MRFIWGMIIANWKLFRIPCHDDLKYSQHWQFLTVSTETEFFLNGMFILLPFNTIIDMIVSIILLFVSYLSHMFLVPILLSFLFSLIRCFFKNSIYILFLLLSCNSLDFFFHFNCYFSLYNFHLSQSALTGYYTISCVV